MGAIRLVTLAAACIGVALAADGVGAETPGRPDPFRSFECIEPNVGFWTRVYGEWSLGQVAVHDLEYVGVVYDVVDLPGPIADRYTEEQRDFVRGLAEAWQDRLRSLEGKIERAEPLDEQEKALALKIATEGGTDALEGAHERVRTQRGIRERFKRGIEISHRYDALIREAFRDAGLPEDLAYLPHVESSFQADARSSAGAVGVWQFTRGAGRTYMHVNAAVDERLDPVLAAHGAARYLGEAYRLLGDWALALTSYNHGIGGMERAVRELGRDYPRVFSEYRGRLFGFASRNFYAEFLAARAVASDPEPWFPEGITPEPPHDFDRLVLDAATTPARLARTYGLRVTELAAINPAWSERAVRSGLALTRDSVVWLPRGALEGLAATAGPDHILGGPEAETTYVVRPGDTLIGIAASLGTNVAVLREINGMPPGSTLIRAGQELRIGPFGDATGEHVVRRGETLSRIASRYGMSVAELRILNGLGNRDNVIHPGQRLRVEATGADAARIHVVRAGETLLRIAVAYGVGLSDLLTHNQLTEASIIHPGQLIRIPGL